MAGHRRIKSALKTYPAHGAMLLDLVPKVGEVVWRVPHGHDFVNGVCQNCGLEITEMPALAPWRRRCTGKLEEFK